VAGGAQAFDHSRQNRGPLNGLEKSRRTHDRGKLIFQFETRNAKRDAGKSRRLVYGFYVMPCLIAGQPLPQTFSDTTTRPLSQYVSRDNSSVELHRCHSVANERKCRKIA
jgi:hypothetical protein